MNLIGQGLLISALGMSITFVTLGVLILLIRLLRVVFPAKAEPPLEVLSSMPDEVEAERRAAIFAALWYWQNQQTRSPDLGERLEQPQGIWWAANKDTNI